MNNLHDHVEDTEDKEIYYIFPKKDPQSVIQFTKGRDDLFDLVDVGTHILVVLEDWGNEYGREGETRFFRSDEQEKLDEWMKGKKEDSILRFEVHEGSLVHAWKIYDVEESKWDWDWAVGFLIWFFVILSPLWFLLAIVLAYLYFF
ncbi:hypothetical protein J2Z48_003160 [Croceifilum oryzae]|uniref:Uncharacterized protein n=1 Tax=Croceifilum oryzae TaxID=1553429 RepID=A0AAJ1THC7_9BACL|nr:hypothetical protein [Croceifilum oryzae]MDQ0418955.1 hypothetical protein [Croceifilum oryzae]